MLHITKMRVEGLQQQQRTFVNIYIYTNIFINETVYSTAAIEKLI